MGSYPVEAWSFYSPHFHYHFSRGNEHHGGVRYREDRSDTRSLTAVQIYDFHIFTNADSSVDVFITSQHNGQLPLGLLAQLVEHGTGVAEIMGSNPVQAWIYFRPHFYYRLRVCVHKLIKNSAVDFKFSKFQDRPNFGY